MLMKLWICKPHLHVNRGYCAVISREITGEIHVQASKHPHWSHITCPVPCLCHRHWFHMLVIMSNTHIERGEGAEMRRGGGWGEKGGLGSGRELPRFLGRGTLVQQMMKGAGMGGRNDGTYELVGYKSGAQFVCLSRLTGEWGLVRWGRGRAGEGPHTCTKER